MKINIHENFLIDINDQTPFVNHPLNSASISLESFKGFTPLDFSSRANRILLNSATFEKNGTLKTELAFVSLSGEPSFMLNQMMIGDAVILGDGSTILAETSKSFALINTSNANVKKVSLDCTLDFATMHVDGSRFIPAHHTRGTYYVFSPSGEFSKHHLNTSLEIGRLQHYRHEMLIATLSDYSIALFDKKGVAVWNTKLPPAKHGLAPWFYPIFINNELNTVVCSYGDGTYANPSIYIALLNINTGAIEDTLKIPATDLNGVLMHEYTNNTYINSDSQLVSIKPLSIKSFKSYHP